MCIFLGMWYGVWWLCCVLGYFLWCYWFVGGCVGYVMWLFFCIFCGSDFCGGWYSGDDIIVLVWLRNQLEKCQYNYQCDK